jgi:hypothetical protein
MGVLQMTPDNHMPRNRQRGPSPTLTKASTKKAGEAKGDLFSSDL